MISLYQILHRTMAIVVILFTRAVQYTISFRQRVLYSNKFLSPVWTGITVFVFSLRLSHFLVRQSARGTIENGAATSLVEFTLKTCMSLCIHSATTLIVMLCSWGTSIAYWTFLLVRSIDRGNVGFIADVRSCVLIMQLWLYYFRWK